jgi:hypothetical protein
MKVVPVSDNMLGFDCYEPLTLTAIDALAEAGYEGESFGFVVRYTDNLTIVERDNILTRFGLMTVGVAPNDSMASPSAAFGTRDGLRAVTKLLALGIPTGVTHSGDTEGTPNATKVQIIAYENALYDELVKHSEPGFYNGWGDPLSGAELYQDLKFTRYWAASPKTTVPAVRGFGLIQEKENVEVVGYKIDINRHHIDLLGGSFHMLVAGDPS